MKILIIGGGGREHALAWKGTQSPRVDKVFLARQCRYGAGEPRCENVAVQAEDVDGLLVFAQGNKIHLTRRPRDTAGARRRGSLLKAAGLRCPSARPSRGAARGLQHFPLQDFLARQESSDRRLPGNFLPTSPQPRYSLKNGAHRSRVRSARRPGRRQGGVDHCPDPPTRPGPAAARDMSPGNALGEAGHRCGWSRSFWKAKRRASSSW